MTGKRREPSLNNDLPSPYDQNKYGRNVTTMRQRLIRSELCNDSSPPNVDTTFEHIIIPHDLLEDGVGANKQLQTNNFQIQALDSTENHPPEIRYCFKATVADDSTTATFTFFSPNADVITNIECWRLVKELGYSDPHELPPQLEAIKGIHHIFQFHYNPSSKKGSVEFILDTLLDDPIIEAVLAEPAKRQAFDTSDIKELDTKKQKNKATTVITDK